MCWPIGRGSRSFAFVVLLAAVFVAGCGSATSSSSSVAPTATVSPAATSSSGTPASTSGGAVTCPSGPQISSALGLLLPNATQITSGTVQLPAGATAIACDYHASTANVLIEVLTNVNPALISQFSAKFPAAYSSVSGVGDQARSFVVPLGTGNNEGIVASKGSTMVSIVATRTPASITQLGSLASAILG